jgi:N-acetylmuramoyl-L-alanine amidase
MKLPRKSSRRRASPSGGRRRLRKPGRARKNKNRSRGASRARGAGGIRKGLLRILKHRVTWATAAISVIGSLLAVVSHATNLYPRFKTYLDERQYVQTLKRPYPDLLADEHVADWTSGRVRLALFQLDGYLGRHRSSAPWIKTCLTNRIVFPDHFDTQFNERLDLPDGYVDRHNRAVLQRRLDKIDYGKTEDTDILRIDDPFTKLLTRSSKQLLFLYKDSEINRLEKAELYLLRNAMYGRHGYPFGTAKLNKFANRMGWPSADPNFKLERMNQVELCNAFFLDQLYPTRELGALGRGILVRPVTAAPIPKSLESALCTCLAKPKNRIDCRKSLDTDRRAEFRDFVDLIIEFAFGVEDKSEWTFLDEREVALADRELLGKGSDKFHSSALELDHTMQAVFRAHNHSFVSSPQHHLGAYWGVRLTFSKDTLQAIDADQTFSRELAGRMCEIVRESLELTGHVMPRTIQAVQMVEVGNEHMEIRHNPIKFDDLRIRLTQQYVEKHSKLSLQGIELTPRMIVVQRAGTDHLQHAFNSMLEPSMKVDRSGSTSRTEEELNFSVHFLIDRNGAIYSLMKDFEIARHVAGLDRHAIGIKAIGRDESSLTESQVQAAARLVRFLRGKYQTITHLLGNSETPRFEGTPLWEFRGTYARPNQDPGDAFMNRLRARLGDLDLKSAP